ncbi:unnamed protein product [Brachionus calyciflorus]|uniref:Uncharacterized protein n=1 Tax=Brachionus calyciflorus TaxID=104777 RepID=A0A814JY30_9BILA|nr:unnamed protein product [Brachionus calyciflorus]
MLSKQTLKDFYSSNEKNLNLVNQNYEHIDEHAFDELSRLETLNLSSNKLQILNSTPFLHLINLKKLILSFNSINSLPANVFSSLSLLEQFEMTNCNLNSIDSTSFNGLINLKRLILAYNDLVYIQPESFFDLLKLEVAVFSFNKLEHIHQDTFKNQKNLKRLNLKANNLNQVDKKLFINLINLEQIIISVNSLISIDNIFENNKNLQRIMMHSNKLQQLTKFSFKGLEKIFSIDLANNLIETIDEEAFNEIQTLKYLDMSKNHLRSLGKNVFNNLTNLDELILSKNLITTLDPDLFEKNVNLKLLRVDFNQIISLNPDIIKHLNSLLEISCNTISINNMKELQEKIISLNKSSFLLNIEFINSFDDVDLIFNSYEALEILQRLSLFTNRHKAQLFSTIQSKDLKTLTKILIKMIENIFQDLSSHIRNFKPFTQKPKCYRLRFLSYTLSIFKNWSKTLKLFCNFFNELSGIEILLKYLNSNCLKKNILEKKDNDSKYTYIILVDIYGDLLNLVYNLIISDQESKKKLSENNCFDFLIETAETLNNVSDLDFKTYLIISELIDDEPNLKRLKNINKVIENLVTYIKVCVNRLNENDQNLDDQAEFIDNVLIFEINNNFYYLTDFLNVLYNFAINDETKFDIYETYSMKTLIKILMIKGNKYEKEITLKLLCQLCFDKRILKNVESDGEICSCLNQLIEKEKTLENILWKNQTLDMRYKMSYSGKDKYIDE